MRTTNGHWKPIFLMGIGKPIFFIDFCNYIVYNLMILFRLQKGDLYGK